VRGWIDGGMTQAISDLAIREHTLTAYTDVRAVCRALGVVGVGRVVPVLVAGGRVRWQGAGPVDDAQLAKLLAARAVL